MAMHRYAFWTQVHPATSPALSSSKSESNKSSKINKYKKVRQLAIRFQLQRRSGKEVCYNKHDLESWYVED
jgi:hypothetical protein